jgi:hypothetical protein
MHDHVVGAASVVHDPKRSYAGPKSRNAAVLRGYRVLSLSQWLGAGVAASDSERFRFSPRTFRPLCGRLSVR